MKTHTGLSRREFELKFVTNKQCMIFLVSQKWDSDYIYRKYKLISHKRTTKFVTNRE